MNPSQSPPFLQSASSATATSDPAFVETVKYYRFVEFCDACREFPLYRDLLRSARNR